MYLIRYIFYFCICNAQYLLVSLEHSISIFPYIYPYSIEIAPVQYQVSDSLL